LEILVIIALALAIVHFGIPLTYYFIAKRSWLPLPWKVKRDENYKPKISIILPTYNEAAFIWNKLNDIYAQNYPKNLIEVIVVDSASDDGTVDLVKKWASMYKNINLKLVEETERNGKLSAILESLKHVSSESSIVVFTDADAFWEHDALNKATTYFADPSVGAVTSSITYSGDKVFENTYRGYYNTIRIAESKFYATPVHNGPFLAIRTELLKKFGLPTFPGSDDSSFGSYIALLGFRAIQVDNITVKEPIRGSQLRRSIRRAQHLLLNFLKTKRYAKKLGVYRHTKPFEKVWRMEWWLHVVNPWLLLSCTILLIMSMFYGSFAALILLGTGLIFLMLKSYRTWVLQQLYLIVAAVRNLWTKEIAWEK
jgi:cellulose synthase/poly-beta-1,6-N-acetylglucosamine synthase-like glycosyltransferase